MIRITAPYFCAAVVLGPAGVVRAAPILGYMRGWSAARVLDYAARKGWATEVLE